MPSSQPNQWYTVKFARVVIMEKQYLAKSEEHALALAMADEKADALSPEWNEYPEPGHIELAENVGLIDIVDYDTIWEARLSD